MATSIGARKNLRWKSVLDFLAVAGPIICLIDCVVLPVASALLPFIGHADIVHGINDQAIVCMVLAICLPIIVPGYLKHRSNRVLGMFVAAISIMMFMTFSGIELGEVAHGAISICTAFLLIKANRENKKLLSCACSFHTGADHEQTIAQPAHAHGFQQVLFVNDETANAHSHAHAHHHHEHGGSCGHDHSHDHSNAHSHANAQSHTHSHSPVYAHIGPTLQDVVTALELKEHLDPYHFEPRNNLNFEPPAVATQFQVQTPAQAEAPPLTRAQMAITAPFQAVSYCG